jgi:uroporphyrinogen-III decarboxylase
MDEGIRKATLGEILRMISKKMTPRERVFNAIGGKKPDKLPIMVANSNTFICQYYGISVEDFLTKPDLCAEGNIRFIEEFQVDYCLIVNGYILYGCGPELGVGWQFVENNFPGFVQAPIKSGSDLDKIKVPSEPSGYFRHYLQVIRKVNEAIGSTYHLSVSILGPFAVACFLRGIEDALIDTIMNPDFFKAYMERCTELSVYFGKNILSTGLRSPILNEIFLSPEMIRPDTYHSLIAPYDLEVQRQLGPQNAPNSLAAFMGKPNDRESQKGGASLYRAFYGVGESVEVIKAAIHYRLPGFPFPASISGRALNSWDTKKILSFLKQTLDFLVKEEGLFPSITLISVQAESPDNASNIADKMNAIKAFRDEYEL